MQSPGSPPAAPYVLVTSDCRSRSAPVEHQFSTRQSSPFCHQRHILTFVACYLTASVFRLSPDYQAWNFSVPQSSCRICVTTKYRQGMAAWPSDTSATSSIRQVEYAVASTANMLSSSAARAGIRNWAGIRSFHPSEGWSQSTTSSFMTRTIVHLQVTGSCMCLRSFAC
ncbi:hypothetical protein BCR37DRAFT_90692 [Protomyces lactucae-debilis]|uniref:Uncharacterized protein n=1 Tax=Protomyces lactucae-debilis TaxID=2754530 RepID=A0A1Y2F6A6_PROLT|nr:uncharacterized protein BCR37DRAFT_90692 [Protomyces lactucae-debilis]ORY79438.1 hypothetical protein BCR37DRAFT_90692 [Protomyces lactucae-debilis]